MNEKKKLEAKALRAGGRTWKEVALILGVSQATAINWVKQAPEYPIIHEGQVYRPVINPRLLEVKIGDKIVPAVIKPGNYPPGRKVKVEQLDEKRYRVLRN